MHFIKSERISAKNGNIYFVWYTTTEMFSERSIQSWVRNSWGHNLYSFSDKKVLLLERKRRTAYPVSGVCCPGVGRRAYPVSGVCCPGVGRGPHPGPCQKGKEYPVPVLARRGGYRHPLLTLGLLTGPSLPGQNQDRGSACYSAPLLFGPAVGLDTWPWNESPHCCCCYDCHWTAIQ